MRFALLCLLLAACPSADPFDVTVINNGDSISYLQAGASTGLLIPLAEEWRGEWQPLASRREALCVPECGSPSPVVSCAEGAAELGTVHALLGGDSVGRSFGGDWWWLDDSSGCARRTVLDNPLRATLCHGASAVQESSGLPLDEPDVSGIVDASGGASVDLPLCEDFEFDLAGRSQVVFEVNED